VTTARRALGASGEDAAAAWYEANGYEVVARNWRCRQGELDLVARRGRTFVFCEVKTRTTTAFGAPVEAVTRTKQARIRVLAARWLSEDGKV
jgi:putative endonuclease